MSNIQPAVACGYGGLAVGHCSQRQGGTGTRLLEPV